MSDPLVLESLMFGAFAGAIGQVARVTVGLKKLNDEANASGTTVSALMETNQIVTSILIGLVAGVLGVVTNNFPMTADAWKASFIELAFIGYAGADFIEGLIRRERPAGATPTVSNTPGTTTTITTTPATSATMSALGVGPQIELPKG